MNEIDSLIDDEECRRLLGNMGKTAWYYLDRRGELPRPIRIGRKLHRLSSEMRNYIERLAAARDEANNPN